MCRVLLFGVAVDQPGWIVGAPAIYLVTGTAALVRPDAFRPVRGTLGVGIASLAAIFSLPLAALAARQWTSTCTSVGFLLECV